MSTQSIGMLVGCLLLSSYALSSVLQDSAATADKMVMLPIQPGGKYAFLSQPIQTDDKRAIIESLPFRSIELQTWGQPDLSNFKNGADARVTFSRDGVPNYYGVSGVERIGKFTGEISLADYGRICLLLECLGVDKADTRFGREAQGSHPVIQQLTVHSRNGAAPLVYRNDLNFGDYRFWLVQSVIENIVTDIEWRERYK